jgi:hypothetical protein
LHCLGVFLTSNDEIRAHCYMRREKGGRPRRDSASEHVRQRPRAEGTTAYVFSVFTDGSLEDLVLCITPDTARTEEEGRGVSQREKRGKGGRRERSRDGPSFDDDSLKNERPGFKSVWLGMMLKKSSTYDHVERKAEREGVMVRTKPSPHSALVASSLSSSRQQPPRSLAQSCPLRLLAQLLPSSVRAHPGSARQPLSLERPRRHPPPPLEAPLDLSPSSFARQHPRVRHNLD